MPSRIRQFAGIIGSSAGVALALALPLAVAPGAAADPGPNCMMGLTQVSYCDTDVSADGSWVRCARQVRADVSVFGGSAGYTPLGAGSCERVTAASLPAGSPPYHIGYGGEAVGRA